MAMKKTGFLRVSSDLEDVGLDAAEFSPAKPSARSIQAVLALVVCVMRQADNSILSYSARVVLCRFHTVSSVVNIL